MHNHPKAKVITSSYYNYTVQNQTNQPTNNHSNSNNNNKNVMYILNQQPLNHNHVTPRVYYFTNKRL